MGGRGSSSGNGSGGLKMITVNAGGTHLTYREHGGKTYSIEVGNSPQGPASNKSLAEIKKNAEKAGFQVKTYNKQEYAQYEKTYRENRKVAEARLNKLWYEAAPKPRKGWKGH